MAENSSRDQSTGTADRPATTQPPKRAVPAVFGDGSTKDQQQQQLDEAKVTNQLVKDAGNAEREARAE